MDISAQRAHYVAVIDDMMRQITWHGQKQSLQTLNHPTIGLTMPQMITLFAIDVAGTCRMSELADVTSQSAGTLTGIVDRLIDDGLVARVRDADDRRVVQVALTPAGKEKLALVQQARLVDMTRLLHRFDMEQLHQFEDLLRLLLGCMRELSLGEEAANKNYLPQPQSAVSP